MSPAVVEDADRVEAALRDGRVVRIRPTGPEDRAAIEALLGRMSPRSLWLRFFSGAVDIANAARQAVETDGVAGVVATSGTPDAVIGHALLAPTGPTTAEVAFEVADEFQGRGIATLMLARLVALARARGITTLTALVLPDNNRMIQVFRDSGFAVRVHAEPGELHVEMATDVGAGARSGFDERDRVATAAAVAHFLAPSSVALVGASRRPDSVGAALERNLRESFAGPLHVVSRGAKVSDIEGEVELAVIAVPGSQIDAVVRDCAAKRVKGLLVVSAGFEDADGVERRRRLAAFCRAEGMRLVGPNCLGVATASLNATFARSRPLAGRVALASQSGGVAIAALEGARAHGVGFSGFVSIGDRADLSSNDFLQYWEEDPETDVIALYLESFGNPRRFARIASRVARRKPVVAVKAGRTRAGARAAGTHTGALITGSDATVDALFAQSGVLRTDTYTDLLDLAAFLAIQPAPAGARIGVVTNAGGPAILFADAAEAAGLVLAQPGPDTRRELAAELPDAATAANPMDVLGDAGADRFGAAIAAFADDPAFDALAVVYVPTPPLAPEAAAEAMVEALARAQRRIPVVAAFLTEAAPPARLHDARVPAYPLPEVAARVLGAAVKRGRWLATPPSPPACAPEGVDRDAAVALVAESLGSGGGWLSPDAVRRLAGCYGLPLVEQETVRGPAGAARAAERFGRPVALKAIAPGLTHKSDAGGVELGLGGAVAVRRAARRMAHRLRRRGTPVEGFLVQPMAAPGVELLIGIASDPVFGPVMACAAGGTATELLADASVRLAPLSEHDLHAMPAELATFPLLTGHRGAPRADLDALADVLRRVSALADDLPAVAELDCNPVIAGPAGATIVDMRVRIAPPAPHPRDGVLGR